MTTVGEIANHLTSIIDVLPPVFARDIVNQAQEELYDEREWGFLWTEGVIRVPALVNTSTVSVTRYSKNVIVSIGLKAVLDSLTADDVDIIGRQFKTTKFEQEYTIENWDSAASVLTLSDMYLGSTDASATYQIYKRFYYPPEYTKSDGSKIIDFGRFESVVDFKNQYKLSFSLTNSWISDRDAWRFSEGNPYAFIPHQEKVLEDGSQLMSYELYPVSKVKEETYYKVLYVRKGYRLEEGEHFPNIFSKRLLVSYAEVAAYKWAQANRAKYSSLQKTNFENLIVIAKRDRMELLERAFKRDEEAFPQALVSSYDSYPFFGCNDYYGLNETVVTYDGVGNFRF